jgi:hypothetical protein
MKTKTLEELYKEIVADEKMKDGIVKAYKEGKVVEFVKAHGCDATMDEIVAFAKTKLEDFPVLAMLL